MSYPYSVEEIDEGMIQEGVDMLDEYEYQQLMEKIHFEYVLKTKQSDAYGYWLDDCGDDIWYCKHCLQPECGKRMEHCLKGVIK